MATNQIKFNVGYNVDKTSLNEIKSSLSELSKFTATDLLNLNKGMKLGEAVTKTVELRETVQDVQNALSRSFNSNLGTLNISKFNNELKKLDINKVYKDFNALGPKGTSAFRKITTEVLTTNMQLKQTHSILDGMADTMSKTIKWGIASSIMNTISGSIQQAWGYAKNLDSSLNDIQIVTGKTADEMERFAEQANKAAKGLATGTVDYTKAALIYYQQGLGEQDVAARAETTIKAANVTGQDTRAVSEQLTAVWNGYKVSAQEAETYVDKLAAVAATTAADLQELSVGMSKVASAANIMGVDVDQLNATLATVISVTRQAPESVGTAFKTIYARMGDIQAGLDTETTLDKYTQQVKDIAGVNVLDTNNQLRDMGEVIEEVGNKWTTLSREQQIALSQAMAGTRQYNNLLALFDNWDIYNKSLETSSGAIDTLQNQQDIYMQSTEAHLKELTTASEDLWDSLIDTKGINQLIDLLKNGINLTARFVDTLGGGGNVLLGLGSIAAYVFSKQIANGVNTTIVNFQNAQENAKILKTEINNLLDTYYKSEAKEDPIVKSVLDARAAVQKYSSVLSVEQMNQANGMIKELANAKQLEQQWQDNIAAAQQYINNFKDKEVGVDFNLQGNVQDFNISEYYSQLESYQERIEGINKSFLRLKQEIKELPADVKENKKEWDNVNNSINKCVKKAKELADDKNLDKNIAKNIQNRILNVDINTDKGRKAIQDLINFVEQASKDIKEKAKNANDVVEKEFEQGAKQSEGFRQKVEEVKSSLDNFNKSVEQIGLVQTITQSISAVGSLAFAFQNLGNVANIIKDDELDGWQKFLRILTLAGTTIPMLTLNIGKLSEMLGINKALMDAYILKKTKKITLDEIDLLYSDDLIKALYKTSAIRKINLKDITREELSQKLLNVAKKNGINLNEENALLQADLILLRGEEVAATNAATSAQERFNIAALKNPYVMLAAALIATIGAMVFFIKKAEAATKQRLEEIDKVIEETRVLTEERKAVEELAKSYEELYRQYADGTDNKDELIKSTLELCDKYGIECNMLDLLAGRYDKVRQAIEAKRAAELEDTIKEQEKAKDDAAEGIGKTIGKKDPYSFNRRDINLNYSKSSEEDRAIVREGFKKFGVSSIFKEEEGLQVYEALLSMKKEFEEKYTNEELKNNRLYKSIVERLEGEDGKAQKYYNAYKENESNVKNNKIAMAAANVEATSDIGYRNIGNLKDFEEYKEKIKQESGLDEEEAEKLVNRYLSQYANLGTYVQQSIAKNQLIDKFVAKDKEKEIKEQIKKWEESGDLDIVLSLGIDEGDTLEVLNQKLEIAKMQTKNSAIEASKILNDAIAEMLSENGLSEDTKKAFQQKYFNEIDWETFDASSQIDQLKTINALQKDNNKLMLEQYDISVELSSKERAEKLDKEIDEKQRKAARIENKIETSKHDNNVIVTQEEKDELESLINELESLYRLKEIDTTINFDDTQLNIFSNAVENVVSSIEKIKSATELIGEGFLVAAEDAEKFAAIYPEMLESAKVLADGQIQLNQDVVNSILDGNSIIINQDKEKTREELENKIFLLDAELEYQKIVIENIEDYLKGEKTKQEITNNLNKASADFESQITERLTKDQLRAYEEEIKANDISTERALNHLDDIGKRIAIVSKAYARMLTGAEVEYQSTVPITDLGEAAFTYDRKFNPDDYEDKDLDGQLAKERLAQEQKKYNEIAVQRAKYTALLSKLNASGTDSLKEGKATNKDIVDLLKDQYDRYHDINIELKQIETVLKRLTSLEKKLIGQELLDNLNEQLGVLEKQIEAYKTKLELTKEEAAEIRESLANQGVNFNEDETISNYAAILVAKEMYVNQAIEKYNSLSEAQQKANKDELEAIKKQYEEFKKEITNYDTLISQSIPELEDKIQEIADKEIEINIKKFTAEVKIRLDMSEAERQFNQFKTKVIDKIKDTDILGNAKSDVRDLITYFNTAGSGKGSVQALTSQVDGTLRELKAMEEGTSAIYGNDRAKALSDLKTYYSDLMSKLTDVDDLVSKIEKSYLDMIDEATSAFDEQINQYEYINDLINHNINIIGLLYGDEAYTEMEIYYSKIEQNNNKQLDFLRQRVKYAEDMMNTETDPDARKKWEEEWKNSLSSLNSKVEDSIKNITDKYANSVNKVFKDLEKTLTGGSSLQYIKDDWDLINKRADMYLDTINRTYSIQQYENKLLNDIDNADSINAQRQLNDLMNSQLKILKEKDKLTKYDVERANKMYDITLKQIALQEAQQNKSTMRLKRDSQGNYSYQYVADEDSISKAKDDLAAAQNDLYNFDKEQYKSNQEEVIQLTQEFAEKYKEIQLDKTLSDEERQKRLLELTEHYEDLINSTTAENLVVRNNLQESAFMNLSAMNEISLDEYRNMSETEKDILMNDLVPTWDSGVQMMIDKFTGEGGFIPLCVDAFAELDEITKQYRESLDVLAETAGVDFNSIAEGHDLNIQKAGELLKANDLLINQYGDQITAIGKVKTEVNQLIAQYNAARTAAIQATQAAYAYWQATQGKSASATDIGPVPYVLNKNGDQTANAQTVKDFSGGDGMGNQTPEGNEEKKPDIYLKVLKDPNSENKRIFELSSEWDEEGTFIGDTNAKDLRTTSFAAAYAKYERHFIDTPKEYRFNTGGYTGEWGSEPRIAMLDQKELVLNATDTKNILDTVSIVRTLDSVVERLASKLQNIASIAMPNMNESTELNQNVKIEANFPNASNAKEIEDAFNNLVNIAAQHAFNTTR